MCSRILFLPPSDANVRSFLCLLYSLIKLYYTKALSDQASSLGPDWILHWRPRILVSFCGLTTTFHWEILKAGGEGDDRRWDGWMVSPTRWTWVWVSSGSWWRTGKPGGLQSMGSPRVRHDWVIELNWGSLWLHFHSWLLNWMYKSTVMLFLP